MFRVWDFSWFGAFFKIAPYLTRGSLTKGVGKGWSLRDLTQTRPTKGRGSKQSFMLIFKLILHSLMIILGFFFIVPFFDPLGDPQAWSGLARFGLV
jgi:hypothetical protein